MDKNNLWVDFMNLISSKLTPMAFNTWFKSAKLLRINNNNLIILVDNEFIKSQLDNYYEDFIEENLKIVSSQDLTFDIVTEEESIKETVIVEEEEAELPKYKNINSNLNKSYTFDNFLVGESNRLAQTVAFSVAEQPGKIYNPLFIYGKSGLGKTHLMHAIGNYIVENSKHSVLYVKSNDFMDDFTNIFRNGNDNLELKEHFKDKYRNVDILMIDDIQMLSGASKTQDEFFSTFNELRDNGKQIIISSDRSPDDLQMLEERLKTRFAWGLTVCIKPPEFELKVKIVKNKLSYYNIDKAIDPAVYDYIANNCESDVRHIEGAITKLYADIAIYNPSIINLEFATDSLKETWKDNYYIVNNVAKIQKAVADFYNITVENLKSKKRTAEINNARQIAMYISKMTTEETIEKIGLAFNRDHATVIHACKKVEDDIKVDSKLNEEIKEIKQKILN